MGLDAGDFDGSRQAGAVGDQLRGRTARPLREPQQAGPPFFRHVTTTLGIAAIGQKYVSWGTGFVDVQNRGWEDLLFINGHAIRHPTKPGVTRRQRPVLLRNEQGQRFADASPLLGGYGERSTSAAAWHWATWTTTAAPTWSSAT